MKNLLHKIGYGVVYAVILLLAPLLYKVNPKATQIYTFRNVSKMNSFVKPEKTEITQF